MGSEDPVVDLTFKVNFSGDGEAKLKERVKDKLKKFMGDYTDDTLVEYVIVLLRNGRHKDEARKELNVFLGDDSDSFVSWLWDHLASNLGLYIPSQETHVEEAANKRSLVGNQPAFAGVRELDSYSEIGMATKMARKRHNREWKGLVRNAAEPPPLRSSEVENINFEEKTNPSPCHSKKKRSRVHKQQPIKREAVYMMTIDAPRRLLQFAIRDAVGTTRAPIAKEPSSKRLRSVVSISSGDLSLPDHSKTIMSVARVPNPMATVIKAVAEAAEDVSKIKTAGSVFDRRGPGLDFLETRKRHAEFREYLGDKLMNVSQIGTSGRNEGDNSLMGQYSVPKDNEVVQRTEHKDHDKSTAAANTSHKIVDIDVNVNSWKPPRHQVPRNVFDLDGRKYLVESEAVTNKSNISFMKENGDNVTVSNGNVMKRSSAHQEAAPVMTWSRSARGASFAAARFARAPFVRGMHGAFRPRLPFKLGARSLQWKRDAQATPSEAGSSVNVNSFSSSTARSLTYVRTEPKP